MFGSDGEVKSKPCFSGNLRVGLPGSTPPKQTLYFAKPLSVEACRTALLMSKVTVVREGVVFVSVLTPYPSGVKNGPHSVTVPPTGAGERSCSAMKSCVFDVSTLTVVLPLTDALQVSVVVHTSSATSNAFESAETDPSETRTLR